MNIEPIVLPAVNMTDDLAKAIQDAVSSADVKTLILEAAEKQKATGDQIAADQAAAEKAAADKILADQAAAEAAAASQGFSRTVEIGGRSFTFEGVSEAELDRAELNALKVAYAVREPEAAPAVEITVDPAEAARAAEADVLAKTELERKFRAGEITTADYIQQSGALDTYLESKGVSIDSLKAVVETTHETQYEQSWAQAGEAFRASAAGQSWPGGVRNQELLGLKIMALGLMDAPDKVAAIAQAYEAMKQSRTIFLHGDEDVAPVAAPVVVADPAVAAAAAATAAAETVRAAAAAKVQSMASSIFGASSGTSGVPVLSPAVVDAKKIVPADATPAEIMQAWKEEQVKQGKDINATFLAEHRAGAR
jgi:hypothetical protein